MKSKLRVLFLITAGLFIFLSCEKQVEREVKPEQTEELRSIAGSYMQKMKSVLINEIKNNGIVSAVSVCADTAQLLTGNFAKQKGIYLKRVSFKNRNEVDYPDEFEQEVLIQFQEIHDNGSLKPENEYVKVVSENGIDYIRYMKPIFVQGACLNCHGPDDLISDEIKNVLDKKYKNDKARGYKIGDLRGAVSIKMRLD